MPNDTAAPATSSAPMTKEEVDAVVQQILKSERGECPAPDAATLARAYDAIRVNRAAVSSRRASGTPGRVAEALPQDLSELF